MISWWRHVKIFIAHVWLVCRLSNVTWSFSVIRFTSICWFLRCSDEIILGNKHSQEFRVDFNFDLIIVSDINDSALASFEFPAYDFKLLSNILPHIIWPSIFSCAIFHVISDFRLVSLNHRVRCLQGDIIHVFNHIRYKIINGINVRNTVNIIIKRERMGVLCWRL